MKNPSNLKKLFIAPVVMSLAWAGACANAQTLPAYQALVLGQGPTSYFTFDGGSFTSIAGTPAVTLLSSPGTVSSQFAPDVFGNAASSVFFTASTDAVYDNSHHLISGGGTAGSTSTATGSITLLFRTIDPGPPPSGSAGQHFVFSAGGSFGTSNTLALLIENPASAVDPSSLKLRFGDSSTTLVISNNLVPDAWYYFALTYNEAASLNGNPNTNKATWYLGRLGGGNVLVSGTTLNSTNAVAGDGVDCFLGSQTAFTSCLRNPGDGRVDEVAFWDRQLSPAEIQAQFARLPNVALPPRANYGAVIASQSPTHYFKLDGNAVDAMNGTLVLGTNGATPQLGYGFDFFGNQSSAAYFSAGSDALYATANLLNGGGTYSGTPGTGQGSISCLFHALAWTNYSGQKFVFSAGGSTGSSNGCALFFENWTSANPGSLKLRFGDSTSVILPVANLVSEWYYFMMAYDEARTNRQVNWWLAQPGGTLQSGFFSATNGSLAGQGTAFYIGNETTGASGFRYVNSGRQSNGQIDEFAIWNRVVTTNEVLAQFNALTLAPRLALAVSGANAVLSWSSSADPRFVLESTVSLAAPSWSSAGAPSVADGQYRVTNSLGSEPQFYRLRKPSL